MRYSFSITGLIYANISTNTKLFRKFRSVIIYIVAKSYIMTFFKIKSIACFKRPKNALKIEEDTKKPQSSRQAYLPFFLTTDNTMVCRGCKTHCFEGKPAKLIPNGNGGYNILSSNNYKLPKLSSDEDRQRV